jgi:RND family efflux transporter MFP subunit
LHGYLIRVDLQSFQINRAPVAKSPRRQRSNPWLMRLSLLAGISFALWLFGPAISGFADRMRLPLVKTMIVSAPPPAAAAAASGTAANGYVVAARRAALSSDVPGRIVELLVKEGSVVKQGDVVARLYSDEFAAALARSIADLRVAEASVGRAKAGFDAAKSDERQSLDGVESSREQLVEATAQSQFANAELTRSKDLSQLGIGSPRETERSQSEASAAQARMRSLEAALRRTNSAAISAQLRVQVAESEIAVAFAQQQAAQATVQQAQATLDKTNVKAPFDGIVVLKDAEVGEVVSPNVQGGNNARGAVCTMVDFNSLEVQANVPETALSMVVEGGPCAVFLDADPDRMLKGKVDRIWPTADRQKATVEVRVQLLDRSSAIRPEMGVRVVFQKAAAVTLDAPQNAAPDAATTQAKAVLVIPESALVEIGGKTGAFVIERDAVWFQVLSIGERKASRAAVLSGLRVGQRIVLEPPTTLRDSDRVQFSDG